MVARLMNVCLIVQIRCLGATIICCGTDVLSTSNRLFKWAEAYIYCLQVEEALSRLLDLANADPNNVPVLLAMATGASSPGMLCLINELICYLVHHHLTQFRVLYFLEVQVSQAGAAERGTFLAAIVRVIDIVVRGPNKVTILCH